jgi:hypothetical protein
LDDIDWLDLWSLLHFLLYSDYQTYWRNEEPRQPEISPPIQNYGKSTSVDFVDRVHYYNFFLGGGGYIGLWDVIPWGITRLVIRISELIWFIEYISTDCLNTISQRISTKQTITSNFISLKSFFI